MTRSALLLLLSIIVKSIWCISIPTGSYETLIDSRCFNETFDRKLLTLGQNQPVGASVENLISLIEKVERRRPEMDAKAIVTLILQRFHIDGLQQLYGSNTPSAIEAAHRRITDQILSSVMSTYINMEFPEDILTEDEKCALFFTVSHTVNETARYDEDPSHIWQRTVNMGRAPVRPAAAEPVLSRSATLNTSQPIQSEFLSNQQPVVNAGNLTRPWPSPHQEPPKSQLAIDSNTKSDNEEQDESDADEGSRRRRRQDPIKNRAPTTQTLTRYPRERGVASFRNNRDEAIAMNRVILGAAVGLLNPATRSVKDIIKSLVPDLNLDKTVDGQLDPLLAVTLSDLLAIDGNYGMTNPAGVLRFGAKGRWNSTACQTSYRLDTNGTLATLAELRGGIDGWHIGRRATELISRNPRLSLSQLLRSYYSPSGLSADTGYCKREYELSALISDKLTREAENYVRVWNAVQHSNVYTDNKITGYIAESKNQFVQQLQLAASLKPEGDNDYCILTQANTDIKQAPCESAADVFFMLDNMEGEGDSVTEEIALITQAVRALDLRRDGGSVTVLVNAQSNSQSGVVDDYNNPINTPLYALAYNSSSSQCASCRTAWFDNRQMAIRDRPQLLELINKTLMEYELSRASLSGVPSKNFVWFEFGNLKQAPTNKDEKRRYDDFKWRLRYEHRDVPFFFASINNDNIKDLLRREEDWIQMGAGEDKARERGNELVKKICRTPSTFQHNECRTRKSDGLVHNGYITQGYKQYWAMYPEYFIKSYTIHMTFKAEKAKIKVCFSRVPEAERDERNCKEANEEGADVSFTVSNPCQRRTFESCDPFYFTIALSSQQTIGQQECSDAGCKSLDQVKWTFTHRGVQCNSSYLAMPSYVTSVMLILMAVFASKL